ncbi:MAG TPA: DUF2127 domain-containing protein [Candidatus Saccharimonadales bacterium]|nr:DUF2127 domain-containing protein [Candidatus Saccharimonadales bacterium]
MSWYRPKSLFDEVFSGGIILKGIDGLLEFIGGFIFLFLTPDRLNDLIVFLTHSELAEDPHDFFANLLVSSANHFTNSGRLFLIAYLWLNAVIKVVAVIGMLRNKLWAYVFSLITLGLFTLFQLYEILFVKPSLLLTILTLFDLSILWLIWVEYDKIRSRKNQTEAT